MTVSYSNFPTKTNVFFYFSLFFSNFSMGAE